MWKMLWIWFHRCVCPTIQFIAEPTMLDDVELVRTGLNDFFINNDVIKVKLQELL